VGEYQIGDIVDITIPKENFVYSTKSEGKYKNFVIVKGPYGDRDNIYDVQGKKYNMNYKMTVNSKWIKLVKRKEMDNDNRT